ncbi:MAG: hypothetical protein V7782_15395 [Psychromonas sp.]
MKIFTKIARLGVLGILFSTLFACSSNNSQNSQRQDGYYNDAYYRNGINSHHHRNYRKVRPVPRPVRR